MFRTECWAVLASGLLFVPLAGISVPQEETSPKLDIPGVVKGNNEFALALHRRLAEKSDTNFVISPFSISAALAIVHAGARGETAAEMAQALHFTAPPDQLAKGFKQLLADINGRDGEAKRRSELIVAHALWAQKNIPFREDFLSLVRGHYQADLSPLDFELDPEGGRKEINRWVEAKTRDKIHELIRPGAVDSRTKLVVTNAVYLNKSWEFRFREFLTKEEWINTGKGKKRVPMMRCSSMHQGYYRGEGVALLQLPFDDGRLAMLVVLPDDTQELRKLEQELDWSKLKTWIEKLNEYDIEVILPRVKVEARNHLPEILMAMGMRLAFTKDADFSGMVSGGEVHIKDVIHQAYLGMDENGTEAAAATAVIVTTLASRRHIPNLPKATFRADRPFLVFIRDTQTGTIFFTGRVMDPGQ